MGKDREGKIKEMGEHGKEEGRSDGRKKGGKEVERRMGKDRKRGGEEKESGMRESPENCRKQCFCNEFSNLYLHP